jgi:hypothetical protein
MMILVVMRIWDAEEGLNRAGAWFVVEVVLGTGSWIGYEGTVEVMIWGW